MKRLAGILLLVVLAIIAIGFILNVNVTTKQCINYQCYTRKLPLYLKILDFFDRYYNYKQLVKIIINDTVTEQDRVMKIFEWTYENIKKRPAGLPVIDDHVWHIIIRGYGTSDQASDVFTTLCNYAGIDAFFTWAMTPDRSKKIPFSFVKIKDKWYIFDPYNGIYFKDNKGNLLDVELIKSNRYSVQGRRDGIKINYSSYISNLPSIKNLGLQRSNIQSPLNRFLFEIKKWIK